MTFKKGYIPWNKKMKMLEEYKQKLRGNEPWNKGRKIPKKELEQLRDNGFGFKKGNIPWNKNLKGIHLSPNTEFKKGQISLRKGTKLDQKIKEKISQRLKGRNVWNDGITWSNPKIQGENHWNWRGGVSKYHMNRGYNWIRIRKIALEKHGKFCFRCNQFGNVVDHIIPFRINKDNSLENLQILCRSCHAYKTWEEGFISPHLPR